MVYDGGFPSVFDYDSAAVLRTGEEANPTSGASSIFGKVASFLAAEEAPILRAGPLPPGEEPYQLTLFPDEPYNRVQQYGYTPTAEQRASVPAGMEFDHDPTLVQHYYEGPGDGSLPGFNLTQTEREAYGASSGSGSAATPAQQRAQGGAAAQYSKQQKNLWGF